MKDLFSPQSFNLAPCKPNSESASPLELFKHSPIKCLFMPTLGPIMVIGTVLALIKGTHRNGPIFGLQKIFFDSQCIYSIYIRQIT